MLKGSLWQLMLLLLAINFSACSPDNINSSVPIMPDIGSSYNYNRHPNRYHYNGYVKPNSAAYYNPYLLPQQQYYPYHDQDYYYVPPRRYRNVEPLPAYDAHIVDTKY